MYVYTYIRIKPKNLFLACWCLFLLI